LVVDHLVFVEYGFPTYFNRIVKFRVSEIDPTYPPSSPKRFNILNTTEYEPKLPFYMKFDYLVKNTFLGQGE